MIRPERITIQEPADPIAEGHNVISGTVKHVVYLGNCTQVHVEVGAPTDLIVEVPNRSGPHSVGNAPGERVNCVCSHDAVRVLHRSAAQPVTAAVDAADEPASLSPA